MDTDEIDPPRPTAQTANLEAMSEQDLKNYVVSLKTEIERTRAMIKKKESNKSGADSLFKMG